MTESQAKEAITIAYITTFGRAPTTEEVESRYAILVQHLSNKQEGEQLKLFEGENNATQ